MNRLVLTLIFLFGSASAHAAIVVAGGIVLTPQPPSSNLGDYALTLYQDPLLQDPTSVWIDFEYSNHYVTLKGVNTNLDEGSDWYFLHAGRVLNNSTIASGDYPLIVGSDQLNGPFKTNSVTFSPLLDFGQGLEDGPDDFYLGVASPSLASGLHPGEFGWAKLRVVENRQNPFQPPTLELLDAALSFGEQGIIVGTQNSAPEPRTFAQVLGAMAYLVGFSQHGRRRVGCI